LILCAQRRGALSRLLRDAVANEASDISRLDQPVFLAEAFYVIDRGYIDGRAVR